MVDAAKHEADWSREAYTRALGAGFQFNVPSAATLRSLVTSRPFQGRFLKDWAAGLERATLDRVKQQILIGITEGEGIDQMIRRLRGTRAASFKDGVFEINRRSAEMVVRTAVNHVTNAAHNATLQENIQLFPRYRWVSVLDGRTSPICRARAGQIYETGKGPVPPGHPNCRSTIVGVPRGSKRESELAYDAWLRRQPGEVVKDILGPTKAKLFLDGELKIDRFVNRAGEELTLVEIQKREAEAWARAGLQRHI
nr:minor capsid protein [Chelatococcus asaccharovorans]